MADNAEHSEASASTAELSPAEATTSTATDTRTVADGPPTPSVPSPPSSLFKRKSTNRVVARRTGHSPPALKSEAEGADEAEDEAERKRVEETRLLQRFRATQHSATAATSLSSFTSPTSSAPPSQSTAMGGRMIGASFQAEVESKDLVEEQMRAFIEGEIEKRRREREGLNRSREEEALEEQAQAEAAARRAGAGDAALKEVAELLRKKPVLDEREEESADRWLRGISEVPLPISSAHTAAQQQPRVAVDALLTRSDGGFFPSFCSFPSLPSQSSNGEHRANGSRASPAAATAEAEVDHESHSSPLPVPPSSISDPRTDLAPSLSSLALSLFSSSPPPDAALPANFNSNFALHKAEWDAAMREQWRAHTEAMEKHREEQRALGIKVEEPSDGRGDRGGRGRGGRGGRGGGGGGFGGGGRGGGGGGRGYHGRDQASDSRAVERFIKRFKTK